MKRNQYICTVGAVLTVMTLIGISGCCHPRCGGLLGRIAARQAESRFVVRRVACDQAITNPPAPDQSEAPGHESLPDADSGQPIPRESPLTEPRVDRAPIHLLSGIKQSGSESNPAFLQAPALPWRTSSSGTGAVGQQAAPVELRQQRESQPRVQPAQQPIRFPVETRDGERESDEDGVNLTGSHERVRPERDGDDGEVTLRAVAVMPYRDPFAGPVRSWELAPLTVAGRPWPGSSHHHPLAPGTGKPSSFHGSQPPATLHAAAVPYPSRGGNQSVQVAELPRPTRETPSDDSQTPSQVTIVPLPRVAPDRDAATQENP